MDNELLDLIEEFRALSKSGFEADQILEMMGHDRYFLSLKAVDELYQESLPPLKKIVPIPKHRKHLMAELGAHLLCAPTVDKETAAQTILIPNLVAEVRFELKNILRRLPVLLRQDDGDPDRLYVLLDKVDEIKLFLDTYEDDKYER